MHAQDHTADLLMEEVGFGLGSLITPTGVVLGHLLCSSVRWLEWSGRPYVCGWVGMDVCPKGMRTECRLGLPAPACVQAFVGRAGAFWVFSSAMGGLRRTGSLHGIGLICTLKPHVNFRACGFKSDWEGSLQSNVGCWQEGQARQA